MTRAYHAITANPEMQRQCRPEFEKCRLDLLWTGSFIFFKPTLLVRPWCRVCEGAGAVVPVSWNCRPGLRVEPLSQQHAGGGGGGGGRSGGDSDDERYALNSMAIWAAPVHLSKRSWRDESCTPRFFGSLRMLHERAVTVRASECSAWLWLWHSCQPDLKSIDQLTSNLPQATCVSDAFAICTFEQLQHGMCALRL